MKLIQLPLILSTLLASIALAHPASPPNALTPLHNREVKSNTDSGVSLYTYTDNDCEYFVTETAMKYDTGYTQGQGIGSFRLTRNLTDNEQLDFSTQYETDINHQTYDWCGVYADSYGVSGSIVRQPLEDVLWSDVGR